jgi:hypothetical protein
MIIGITGKAGAGKDTVANVLCRTHAFVKISLADPIKDACQEWFGWDNDTLWGPSELRNAIDPRYGKAPREALQKLGTEFGRAFYPNVWIDYALRQASEYDNIVAAYVRGVVIPDVRFQNELEAIHKAGGKVIRVIRPTASKTMDTVSEVLWSHASETEQDNFPEGLITTTYLNTGTLEDVEREIDEWMRVNGPDTKGTP